MKETQNELNYSRIAEAIREDIRRDLQLTASAGVAPNKFLAKIASDLNKPDGLFVLAPEQVAAFVAALPLRKIPGVELHGASEEKGSIVVTIEDGEGWSVTDSILAVNLAPKVQGLTIAYEYTDDGLELTEA
mgnify:CR=1 FL=1